MSGDLIDLGRKPTVRLNVLRAVLAVAAEGRCELRAVAARSGLGLSATHRHLRGLRDAGLVEWQPGRRCTLRPLVGVVR